MNKIEKIESKRKRKLQGYFSIMLLFILAFYILFSFVKWPVYSYILDTNSESTNAIITIEKNIQGKGVITTMYTYSYEFKVNGKVYTQDSKDSHYKPGDSVVVEYWDLYPEINRLANIQKR